MITYRGKNYVFTVKEDVIDLPDEMLKSLPKAVLLLLLAGAAQGAVRIADSTLTPLFEKMGKYLDPQGQLNPVGQRVFCHDRELLAAPRSPANPMKNQATPLLDTDAMESSGNLEIDPQSAAAPVPDMPDVPMVDAAATDSIENTDKINDSACVPSITSNTPAHVPRKPGLAELLTHIHMFLLRFMVFPEPAQVVVITLWIAHTRVLDAFGFTQLWADVCGSDMNFDGHNVFLTVGSTLDRPGVVLPPLHREWIPVLHPVAAGYWRERAGGVTVPPPGSAWTTVSHWYGYKDLVWDGHYYGGKRDSLVALRGLPRAAGVRLSIASDLEPAWGDYDQFIEDGWTLLKSRDVCRDVDAYLAFLAGSRGELGVAKEGYIVSRGGWISDRSVTYLALGRPVLLQDTGWTAAVSPRPGFLPFHDTADAAAGIREVEADYGTHSAGALALADTLFSGAAVFGPLLSRIL